MTLISQVSIPLELPPVDTDVSIEHFRDHVVRVTLDGRTIGFVETVGRLFVGLAGHRYDHAVEVRQSLDLDHAISDLVAHARPADAREASR